MNYKIPSWSSLTLLGQSKLVKMTMLIPIFGYLILFNESVMSFVLTSFNLESLGFAEVQEKTKLYYIYFGLTSLGLASFVYQISCPQLMKEYSSVRQYLRENVDYMTLLRVDSICNHVVAKSGSAHQVTSRVQKVIKEINDEQLSSLEKENSLRNASIDLLQHFWNLSTWSSFSLRVLVSVLFIIGFLCLLIPSFKMFVAVLSSFVS
jgi:hypothetical protein